MHILFYRGICISILLDYSLSLQYKVCLGEGEEIDNLLYKLNNVMSGEDFCFMSSG